MPGLLGRSPDRWVQGEAHSLPGDSRGGGPLPYPSGEPTTTEAELVVIVGYNRASPAFLICHSPGRLRFIDLVIALSLGRSSERMAMKEAGATGRVAFLDGPCRRRVPASRIFSPSG